MDNYDSHVQGGIDSKTVDIIVAKAQRDMLRKVIGEHGFSHGYLIISVLKELVNKLDKVIGGK